MAKIRKIYDETIKPNGRPQAIYPITSTQAVYNVEGITLQTLLNEGYRFGGIVSTNDHPLPNTKKAVYITGEQGTYTYFGNLTVEKHEVVAFCTEDGNTFTKRVFYRGYSKEDLEAIEEEVEGIKDKIPTQASTDNQLADKAFVNSTVQTGTANFRGNWYGWQDVPQVISSYPADYAGSKKPTVNDYMVILNTKYLSEDIPIRTFTLGEEYSAGNYVYCDYEPIDGLFVAKDDILSATAYPEDAPELWEKLPDSWYRVFKIGGTWRFKYTGNWDTNGILGWIPEYQVNEEPLTAAQLAALNSNMTAELTNKLQNLPSKPVSTNYQSLSSQEKLQVRTNIDAASTSDIQTLRDAIATKYEKPSGGIPKSDLSSEVKNSIGKADTALQSVKTIASQSLNGQGNIPVTLDIKSDTRLGLRMNGVLVANQEFKTVNGAPVIGSGDIPAYEKPASGIPKSDLASGVQMSLEKADTAVQPEAGKGLFSGDYNDLTNKPTIPDVTGKADKVQAPTAGNFAGLDNTGNITDSGKKASDFATAGRVADIEEKIPTQASSSNQLADKAFVNSTVQYNTANARGNWENQFALPMTATAGDYPVDYAGSYKPSQNDYMVLRDASIWLSFEAQLNVYLEPGVCFLRGSDIYVIDEAEELEIIASHKIAEMGKYEDVSADTVVLDMTASKDFVYPYQGKYYARLVDQMGEETFDITDTTKWCEINDGRASEESTEGTWFFKYSGNWNTANIGGWIPMFQVNEKPLTAAQVAALNSNITAALTNKLVALPAKPVDTAAQTLSDAEKLQARTNIGATVPEVFVATYGTTTASEIQTAIAAGKLVVCVNSVNSRAMLIGYDEVSILFSRLSSSGRQEIWSCSISNNAWVTIVTSMTNSWQATPDNTHYPSEKLVKDSIDAITPFIGTYSTTTSAEISAAISAGQEVWIMRDSLMYAYSYGITGEYSYYIAANINGINFLRLKNATNEWVASSKNFQDSANKVTSLSASATDNQYPSAKAVYDFVKALADANSLIMP